MLELEEKLAKRIKARDAALNNELHLYYPVWHDINRHLAPYTAKFGLDSNRKGVRQDRHIINNQPLFAVRALAAGMQSGMTSPLRPWFQLSVEDPDIAKRPNVKAWLHDTEQKMRRVIAKSNLYSVLKSVYGAMGAYGTGCLWIEEDDDDVIRAHHFITGTYRVSMDSGGRPTGLYRDTKMTVEQMILRFGVGNVDRKIKESYDKGDYENCHDVTHVVEANPKYFEGSKNQKPYLSLWFEKGKIDQKKAMRISGFSGRRFFTPRWDLYGEETYGIGCGHMAIGDSKALQMMEKRKLQGIDKNVRPPMVADSSMRNQRKSTMPGDTTYVGGMITGRPGFAPAYQVNPYIGELREEIMRGESHIDEAFYKNLFLVIADLGDQPNITATQITALREEKLMMLGPVTDRTNDELLDPMIDTIYEIMDAYGLVAPPPEELNGLRTTIEYTSIFAQAQKALGIGNIERYVGFTAQIAQIDPNVVHKVNSGAVVDEYAEALALAPNLVNSDEDVAQILEGQSQQQAQAEATASGQAMTGMVKDLASADMSGDSALTRAMEVAGGGI